MSLSKVKSWQSMQNFPRQLVRFLFFLRRWMGYLYVWRVHSRFQWWKIITGDATISLFTWRISLWPNCGFWSVVAFHLLSLTLKKPTPLNVTKKIKATIDQKPQFGHNEMRHVNRLYVTHHAETHRGLQGQPRREKVNELIARLKKRQSVFTSGRESRNPGCAPVHNRLVQCPKISHDSNVFAPVFGHNVHGRSIRTWCTL